MRRGGYAMMRPSDAALSALYGRDEGTLSAQRTRYEKLAERFARQFPGCGAPRFFSAPGRAELGGNHTDHQQGRVLAASVNLDTVAAAAANDDNVIRIDSEGFANRQRQRPAIVRPVLLVGTALTSAATKVTLVFNCLPLTVLVLGTAPI